MYLSQESDDHTPDVLTNHGGGGEGGGATEAAAVAAQTM